MELELLEALVALASALVGAALTAWKLNAKNKQTNIAQIDGVRKEQIEYLTRYAGVMERANEHMATNARHHTELLNATDEINRRIGDLTSAIRHNA